MNVPVSQSKKKTSRPVRCPLRLSLKSVVLPITTAALVSCQSVPSRSDLSHEPGTFLNPPTAGDTIRAVDGSVVCFNQLDAIGMVRTGFFTSSCQSITKNMALVAETVATQDAGEGPVIMVQTTFAQKTAWVPIPWHDWL